LGSSPNGITEALLRLSQRGFFFAGMHGVKPLSLFVTGQIASDSVASFRRNQWLCGIALDALAKPVDRSRAGL
jgi:hypothetical protein